MGIESGSPCSIASCLDYLGLQLPALSGLKGDALGACRQAAHGAFPSNDCEAQRNQKRSWVEAPSECFLQTRHLDVRKSLMTNLQSTTVYKFTAWMNLHFHLPSILVSAHVVRRSAAAWLVASIQCFSKRWWRLFKGYYASNENSASVWHKFVAPVDSKTRDSCLACWTASTFGRSDTKQICRRNLYQIMRQIPSTFMSYLSH